MTFICMLGSVYPSQPIISLIIFADSSTIRSSSVSRPLRYRATSAKLRVSVAERRSIHIKICNTKDEKITSVEIKKKSADQCVRDSTGELMMKKKKREIHSEIPPSSYCLKGNRGKSIGCRRRNSGGRLWSFTPLWLQLHSVWFIRDSLNEILSCLFTLHFTL